jgi:hypothetical protein
MLTWRKADGGPGRRILAEALFERIDVLSLREATIRLTDAAVAHGFAASPRAVALAVVAEDPGIDRDAEHGDRPTGEVVDPDLR